MECLWKERQQIHQHASHVGLKATTHQVGAGRLPAVSEGCTGKLWGHCEPDQLTEGYTIESQC